jgi:two-component system sensor histidine kinase MprB
VLLAAGTVTVTVALASVVCFLAMRAELLGQVDAALAEQARLVQRTARRVPDRVNLPADRLPVPADPGDAIAIAQLITRNGRVRSGTRGALDLEATAAEREIARRGAGRHASDRTAGEVRVRTLTVGIGERGAVRLARSLRGPDATLARLRYVLVVLTVLGALFAVVVARAFARKVVAPVRELDAAAGHIGATHDLTRRISATGDDEVGRMARRFNEMLDALAASVNAQRQLVADASHELRTPVTSLRTNIELLLDAPDLGAAEHRQILAEAGAQAEELSALIAHLLELGRDDEPMGEPEAVYLDEIVLGEIRRARRHAPDVELRPALEPTIVDGDPDRLARGVSNLLQNAVKYGDRAAGVDVTLRDGILIVRDYGPGVPDAEKAQVFDRFFRGAQARRHPGSGLGLAIVRQAATAHGGTVDVIDAPGGGAAFRLCLPTATRSHPRAGRLQRADDVGDEAVGRAAGLVRG